MLRFPKTNPRRWFPLLAGCAAALAARPVLAQGDMRLEATAGSDAEDYLRTLQVAGMAPLYPWSARSFSPAEIDRLAPGNRAHPWAARFAVDTGADAGAPRSARVRSRCAWSRSFSGPRTARSS
jgi:hypothetical protein